MIQRVCLLFTAILLAVAVSGCAQQTKTRTWVDLDEVNKNVQRTGRQSDILEEGQAASMDTQPRVKDMTMSAKGAPSFALGPGKAAETELDTEKGLSLNFDNADIYEFIKVVTETLDINYIVDPKVKGVVNIHSGRKIPIEHLFTVFEKVLHMNGLDITDEGDYFYIHPAKSPMPRQALDADDSAKVGKGSRRVLQVLPIKHLAAAEAIKLIQPYLSESGSIHELSGQNTLIVNDFESKVYDALTILNRLDITPLAALKVRMVRVDNAPLFDLREELTEILSALAINKKDFDGVSVIPLERVNSLLLVSKSEQLLDNVDRWIKELDVMPTEGSDNIYIYTVRNSVASELGGIVNSLIGGETKTDSKTTSTTTSATIKDKKTTSKPTIAKPQGKGLAKLRFAGEPLLLPDDSRNIILIRALTPDYIRVVKLLERLDNLPRQVLIEVLVAEVKLTDEWEFGVEWALKNNKLSINDSRYEQTFSTNFGSSVAQGATGGFTYSILRGPTDVVGLINAIASENDVTILSSPHLLVLNNEEATVNVGDQVPIITTETQQTGLDAVDKTVQYKDTGTILTVTPRINYDGIIILDVNQQVSDAIKNTLGGTESPIITTREIKTKLAVKDSQSILMGGMIKKDKTINQNKVPLLGDIPGLGWLFKYEKESTTKTELLVMITPYVIETEDVLDQYIKQFQNKMVGLRKELNTK